MLCTRNEMDRIRCQSDGARAYQGINSSGRVVKTVMQGLVYLFQSGGLIGLLM